MLRIVKTENKDEIGNRDRMMGFYYLEEDSLDMIMIGSSPVHPYWGASLAYKEYGFTSYPLSTDIQQPRVTSFLVEEALKTQSPSVILVETRMFMKTQELYDNNELPTEYFWATLNNFKYSVERAKFINSIEGIEKKLFLFDIMQYHETWKEFTVDNLSCWDWEKKNLYNGFYWVPRVQKLDVIVDNAKIQDEMPIPKEQEKYFYQIIDFAKKRNQKVVFILAPYQITENDCKMANYMERIVAEAGYEYINFNKLNEEMDIDYSIDFYNSGHMNVLGAEKYTRYLGKLLQKKYNLPDHRGDEKYAQWDVDYEVWKQQAEVTKQQIYQLIDESK